MVGVGKRGERKFSDYPAIREAAKATAEVATWQGEPISVLFIVLREVCKLVPAD